MSNPLPDLLSPTDFAKFSSKDEDWFLGVAGDAIRDYCGWHIYPVISEVNVHSTIGNEGIIMLPSLNVVSVDELRWAGTVVPASLYTVHESGWIELGGATGFVAVGSTQPYLRHSQSRWVEVDLTHGFDAMPRVVAEVGFELTSQTMEKPSGIVSDLTSGPYRFKFNEFGANLTEGQAARLGPYAIEQVT
jgi:hypothetical protein